MRSRTPFTLHYTSTNAHGLSHHCGQIQPLLNHLGHLRDSTHHHHISSSHVSSPFMSYRPHYFHFLFISFGYTILSLGATQPLIIIQLFLRMIALLLLTFVSVSTLYMPPYIQTGTKMLISPSSPTMSQIFGIPFKGTYDSETRMLTYGIGQFGANPIELSVFQTDVVLLNANAFALSVTTLNSMTITAFSVSYLVTQNEPNLFTYYNSLSIDASNILAIGSGFREATFNITAPISFLSSSNMKVVIFIEGFIMNSTSQVLRLTPTANRTYLNIYQFNQTMKITTDQDCVISYISFNVLFVNIEELTKDGFYVSGGSDLIFNENSTSTSFGYSIQQYDLTSVLVGANGFATAANRTISWDTTIDSNGLGLTFQTQDLDAVYFSFLQIGVIAGSDSTSQAINKATSLSSDSQQVSTSQQNQLEKPLVVVIVLLVIIMFLLVLVLFCKQRWNPSVINIRKEEESTIENAGGVVDHKEFREEVNPQPKSFNNSANKSNHPIYFTDRIRVISKNMTNVNLSETNEPQNNERHSIEDQN